MTNVERVAYIKGYLEGAHIDENTENGKIFSMILDVLEDISIDLEDVTDEVAELEDGFDEIDHDLGHLESDFYDCCCCDDDIDDDMYEVECPECGHEIYVDEDALDEGEIDCPICGEHFEIELDDECDCCCGCEDEE